MQATVRIVVCSEPVCGALGGKGAFLFILGVHKLLKRVPTYLPALCAEAFAG